MCLDQFRLPSLNFGRHLPWRIISTNWRRVWDFWLVGSRRWLFCSRHICTLLVTWDGGETQLARTSGQRFLHQFSQPYVRFVLCCTYYYEIRDVDDAFSSFWFAGDHSACPIQCSCHLNLSHKSRFEFDRAIPEHAALLEIIKVCARNMIFVW